MPLIDSSYFVGEVNIPNTGNANVSERLTFFITKYEEELLRAVLGNALYAAFRAGIAVAEDAIDQKWKDLRDGKDYNDAGQISRYWIGLRKASTKQSLIANYTYYWWLRDKSSQTTEVGETDTNTDGAKKVSPGVKMARAWNEMVGWVGDLICFLDNNRDAYPEWLKADRNKIRREFRQINIMGI